MSKIYFKISSIIIVGFLSISLSTNDTYAANKTWNGSIDTNWNTSDNWTPSGACLLLEIKQ